MTRLAKRSDLIESERPYCPYGKALEFMLCREDEVLLSGPAGTGKSRANLEKLHLCAENYPGMRGLIARKTRAACTDSCLVTFETKVVPEHHPILNGPGRLNRQSYKYPNGSEIVVGGMDKPSKTLSTEYDIIYVQEAIELAENDWELLTRPLRNGKMPYQQLMGDTNPDAPHHWLKRRCDTGKTKLLESSHEENPVLWDMRRNDWTAFGAGYIARLDRLTGSRKPRLRFGKWVQSEGVVYEGWNSQIHVIDRFHIPDEWPRYWAIDFGFNNPFVCHWYAEDPEGRLYLYRELYHSRRLVEDHAKQIQDYSANEPRPRVIICDHDGEGRATLEKYLDISTTAADKTIKVKEGIQAVAGRLKPPEGADKRPMFVVLRDSLIERDEKLDEAGKPIGLVNEMDSYVWDLSNNRHKGEEPLKENDHACDALRYMIVHKDVGERKSTDVFW